MDVVTLGAALSIMKKMPDTAASSAAAAEDAADRAEAAQAAAEAAAEQAEGAIEVDDTLSVEGRAADAKVTGDKISALKEDLNEFEDDISTGEIIAIPRTVQNGYTIEPGGTIATAGTNNQVTDPIDVSAYKTLYITARASYGKLLYAFYDSNSVFISGEASNGGELSTLIEDKKVTIPTGAKYLRMSNKYNSTPYPSAKYIEYTVKGIENLSAIESTLETITAEESYQTDFIIDPTYESGYVNKSGSSGSGNYVHTNKISVNEGDRLYLVYRVSGNLGGFRFVTAYDASDNAVSASGAENIGTGGYTVPSGIAKVILSISGTDTTGAPYAIHIARTNNDTVLNSANKVDNLFGKKWCVCGDSFSYGGQNPMPVFSDGRYKGGRKVYPYFIGNRTHISIVDFTGNGRTLAYPSDGTFANSLTNPNADFYYQNIPSDVDYITIYLGINDSHHASGSSGSDGEDVTGVIPIGTVDDTTTATFGGAWNVVLSWLIANRPNAHIGIIVSNGVGNVNYRDMTIAIAKKYGLAYLDLNGDDRTPAMIRTVNPDIAQAVKTALINKWAVEVGVNTHPNTDAHEYESYFIENFLRSI